VDEPFRWRTDCADLSDDQWGWNQVSISDFFKEIAPKLQQLEELSWGELIGHDLVHFISQSKIDQNAQMRLLELAEERVIPEDYLGIDLTSMRITGIKRLWGFKQGKYFYLLWWDPFHTVYPVSKKHT